VKDSESNPTLSQKLKNKRQLQRKDAAPGSSKSHVYCKRRVGGGAVPEMDFGARQLSFFRPRRGIFSPEKSLSLPDAAKEN
jgi:hypothetical protein